MLTRTAVLIATFLFAVPFSVPAFATPTALVSVSPGSNIADIGESFTSSVMVSNAANLAGYDIRVHYDPNVLTATSASLTGTLFDPATHSVLVSRHDILQVIGIVRYLVVILGGSTVTPSPTGSLLNVNFKVNDPASSPFATAQEYPSIINVSTINLVALPGSVSLPTTTTDATYMPPADVGLRSVGCRAANNGFNTNAKGFTDPLFCRVINNGSQSITVRGDFNYASLGGITGSISGPTITLGPGQAAEVNAVLTVAPHTNDIFFVTGFGTRVITFQDSTTLAIQGDAQVFSINVISPF